MPRLHGLFTAIITPFKDNKVDANAFQALIEWQIEQGVDGIVPCGTTGESPTLSHEEHQHVVELAVEAAAGRISVMAGTGSNSTDEAIAFTEHAKRVGADATLVVTPYYNKPTQKGLIAHFDAIAASADIPNFIYNIPGRSVINITDETMATLSKHVNIAGIKDATGDLARVSTLRQMVDDDFIILSGEDMTIIGFNAQGGNGCISVTSNVAPAACAEVQKLCEQGDYAAALQKHEQIVPLHSALFAETNPIGIKYAMAKTGHCSDEIRMPLTKADSSAEAIDDVLKACGLTG
ncbi:MAG: 4-hydroxy-tetrahydrodipicolinate synthase [Rickettsiales bacterium]|nr:4-hydroxy-tetrahydrodipicolinate synthase [Rickettsiales bacterium]